MLFFHMPKWKTRKNLKISNVLAIPSLLPMKEDTKNLLSKESVGNEAH